LDLGELDHEGDVAVAVVAVERPALLALQQGEVGDELAGLLEVVVGVLQVVDDEAEVVPARGLAVGERHVLAGVEEEERGRAGGQHGHVRVVAHLLHLEHAGEELVGRLAVGHDDRQVVEGDVAPRSRAGRDRLDRRLQGDAAAVAVGLRHFGGEHVRVDILAALGAQDHLLPVADVLGDAVVDGVVDDVPGLEIPAVLGIGGLEADRDPFVAHLALVSLSYPHVLRPAIARLGLDCTAGRRLPSPSVRAFCGALTVTAGRCYYIDGRYIDGRYSGRADERGCVVTGSGAGLSRFADAGLLILISLAEGPKHGYAMIADIKEVAGVKLGPGTLYAALSRLEQQGLIEPVESDDRRRPYQLTSAGRAELRDQLAGMETLASTGLQRMEAAR